MIDLLQIIAKIERHAESLKTTVAEISFKATGSKDTIRNWKRSAATKPSATILKLNQVEKALGIELARNANDAKTSEDQLRSSLLAFGVDRGDLDRAVAVIKGFVDDLDGQSKQSPAHDQSEPASPRRERVPSR